MQAGEQFMLRVFGGVCWHAGIRSTQNCCKYGKGPPLPMPS